MERQHSSSKSSTKGDSSRSPSRHDYERSRDRRRRHHSRDRSADSYKDRKRRRSPDDYYESSNRSSRRRDRSSRYDDDSDDDDDYKRHRDSRSRRSRNDDRRSRRRSRSRERSSRSSRRHRHRYDSYDSDRSTSRDRDRERDRDRDRGRGRRRHYSKERRSKERRSKERSTKEKTKKEAVSSSSAAAGTTSTMNVPPPPPPPPAPSAPAAATTTMTAASTSTTTTTSAAANAPSTSSSSSLAIPTGPAATTMRNGAEWQVNQDYTAFYHSTAAYYHDYNNYPQPQAVDGNGSAYHTYPAEQMQLHQNEPSRRTDESMIGGMRFDVLDNVGYPARMQEDASLLFEKIGQVGEGTYGKVYKARNQTTGHLMALKRIRMKADKDGFPITAMREIKLLQRLKHKHIVELQQIMVAKGSVYMVLEYMDHDLSGILTHPNFKFDPAHAKSLVKQMLEGLAYLHQNGILHRDIKGSNLLLNNQGELKIADFGLARIFQKNTTNDYTNRVITLWYRPPELLLGATAYGPAVDIWSVGCIMMEFFANKPPFAGIDEITQLEIIYKTMGTPTPESWPSVTKLPWYDLIKPKETYPNRFKDLYQKVLSPGALELLEAMLSMDPEKRPSAAEALQFDYFIKEEPAALPPANLLDVNGDWHEFESKQRKRQRHMERIKKAPPSQQSNYHNNARAQEREEEEEEEEAASASAPAPTGEEKGEGSIAPPPPPPSSSSPPPPPPPPPLSTSTSSSALADHDTSQGRMAI